MGVDMVQGESCRLKSLQLCAHLCSKRSAGGWLKEIPEPCGDQSIRQPAVRVDDRTQPIRREYSPAIYDDHVQTNAQTWRASCQ